MLGVGIQAGLKAEGSVKQAEGDKAAKLLSSSDGAATASTRGTPTNTIDLSSLDASASSPPPRCQPFREEPRTASFPSQSAPSQLPQPSTASAPTFGSCGEARMAASQAAAHSSIRGDHRRNVEFYRQQVFQKDEEAMRRILLNMERQEKVAERAREIDRQRAVGIAETCAAEEERQKRVQDQTDELIDRCRERSRERERRHQDCAKRNVEQMEKTRELQEYAQRVQDERTEQHIARLDEMREQHADRHRAHFRHVQETVHRAKSTQCEKQRQLDEDLQRRTQRREEHVQALSDLQRDAFEKRQKIQGERQHQVDQKRLELAREQAQKTGGWEEAQLNFHDCAQLKDHLERQRRYTMEQALHGETQSLPRSTLAVARMLREKQLKEDATRHQHQIGSTSTGAVNGASTMRRYDSAPELGSPQPRRRPGSANRARPATTGGLSQVTPPSTRVNDDSQPFSLRGGADESSIGFTYSPSSASLANATAISDVDAVMPDLESTCLALSFVDCVDDWAKASSTSPLSAKKTATSPAVRRAPAPILKPSAGTTAEVRASRPSSPGKRLDLQQRQQPLSTASKAPPRQQNGSTDAAEPAPIGCAQS